MAAKRRRSRTAADPPEVADGEDMSPPTRRRDGGTDEALSPYRAKRRADRTPEPMGAETPARATERMSFVIQEHHARALHWDFRLERDGVLVSWALPKGLPVDPKRNHLAVHTEDHPLEYGSCAGDIPAGEYGGGSVSIWDSGHYDCEKWSEREVMVVLHGTRAAGRYVLFQTGGTQWMIHQMDPAPDGWEPLPEGLRPLLATAAPPPASAGGWSYECKWEGVRALVAVDGGRIRITSRNDLDVTVSYPELRALGLALGSRQVLLDGEIVAFDDAGRASFSLLQQRMHGADAAILPRPLRGGGAARRAGGRDRGSRVQAAGLALPPRAPLRPVAQGEGGAHPRGGDRGLHPGAGPSRRHHRCPRRRHPGTERARVRREGRHRLQRRVAAHADGALSSTRAGHQSVRRGAAPDPGARCGLGAPEPGGRG